MKKKGIGKVYKANLPLVWGEILRGRGNNKGDFTKDDGGELLVDRGKLQALRN